MNAVVKVLVTIQECVMTIKGVRQSIKGVAPSIICIKCQNSSYNLKNKNV